jgi:hypothetical protein
MIYLLVEQVMNGTLTMDIITSGIEAKSFEEAYEKLTHFENWHLAKDIYKTDARVNYSIFGKTSCIWASMKSEPLRIYR